MQNKRISDFTAKLKVTVSNVDNSFFDIEKAQNIIAELFSSNAIKKFELNKKNSLRLRCTTYLYKRNAAAKRQYFSEIKNI
jgi:DNA mismatch repair protein MutS